MVLGWVADREAWCLVSLRLTEADAVVIDGFIAFCWRYSVNGAVVAGRRIRLIAGRV